MFSHFVFRASDWHTVMVPGRLTQLAVTVIYTRANWNFSPPPHINKKSEENKDIVSPQIPTLKLTIALGSRLPLLGFLAWIIPCCRELKSLQSVLEKGNEGNHTKHTDRDRRSKLINKPQLTSECAKEGVASGSLTVRVQRREMVWD